MVVEVLKFVSIGAAVLHVLLFKGVVTFVVVVVVVVVVVGCCLFFVFVFLIVCLLLVVADWLNRSLPLCKIMPADMYILFISTRDSGNQIHSLHAVCFSVFCWKDFSN